MSSNKKISAFSVYAWIVVLYTLFIIVWGAYVRASGSGAGCGSHWPTCHGDIVPRPESIETIIEFTHRITSAILGPMIMILLGWSWKKFGWRSYQTKAAFWSLVFVIIEGGLGAGLVLFGLVADNDTVARAIVMGIHLINTMILLGFITLTAWWGSDSMWGGLLPRRLKIDWQLVIALVGILAVGAIGAVTALGDTLFPAETFLEGASAKFEAGAHFAVKMRTWHPLLAVGFAIYTSAIIFTTDHYWQSTVKKNLAWFSIAIIGVQLLGGFINVLLAAPVWMQLVHLFLADLSWIGLILLFVESGARETDYVTGRFLTSQALVNEPS